MACKNSTVFPSPQQAWTLPGGAGVPTTSTSPKTVSVTRTTRTLSVERRVKEDDSRPDDPRSPPIVLRPRPSASPAIQISQSSIPSSPSSRPAAKTVVTRTTRTIVPDVTLQHTGSILQGSTTTFALGSKDSAPSVGPQRTGAVGGVAVDSDGRLMSDVATHEFITTDEDPLDRQLREEIQHLAETRAMFRDREQKLVTEFEEILARQQLQITEEAAETEAILSPPGAKEDGGGEEPGGDAGAASPPTTPSKRKKRRPELPDLREAYRSLLIQHEELKKEYVYLQDQRDKAMERIERLEKGADLIRKDAENQAWVVVGRGAKIIFILSTTGVSVLCSSSC